MRTLYFDIDGTILVLDRYEPKSCLRRGRLENAIRKAGFEQLICVGNFSGIVRTLKEVRPDYDDVGVLLGMCRDAIADEGWFRSVTRFVEDPARRAASIDVAGDWWYVDDQAEKYLRAVQRDDLLAAHRGGRVFIPDPIGDGQDVLDWLTQRRDGHEP